MFDQVVDQRSEEREDPREFLPSCHIQEFWSDGNLNIQLQKEAMADKYWDEGSHLVTGTLNPTNTMEFAEASLAAIGMESLLLHGVRGQGGVVVNDHDVSFDDIDFLQEFSKFVKDHDLGEGKCVLKEVKDAMIMAEKNQNNPEGDPDRLYEEQEKCEGYSRPRCLVQLFVARVPVSSAWVVEQL